jgi:hypothetical protein
VRNITSWSADLTVETSGRDVINHAGTAALRLITDRTGLTAGLSQALARRGFEPVHDRGRVLADAAVMIADGGRVMADLATLRDQAELFGSVASDSTLWRALDEIGDLQRRRITRARAQTRKHVWSLIKHRHGRIPPSRVADRDLGSTIVIRLDASLTIAHSDKQLAAGTYKGTWGHHPLMAWCDNTSESLALLLRKGNAGANTTRDHIIVLDEAITQIPATHRRNLLITVDGARLDNYQSQFLDCAADQSSQLMDDHGNQRSLSELSFWVPSMLHKESLHPRYTSAVEPPVAVLVNRGDRLVSRPMTVLTGEFFNHYTQILLTEPLPENDQKWVHVVP